MKTLEVSDETYERIKDQLQAEEQIDYSSYEEMIGKSFFFRTVTYHLIGKVTKVMGPFLQLNDASWVADSGRFMNAIKEGELNEVEPLGKWNVNMNSVTDFGLWIHKLPKEQK
jgi:hypothetical protein